MIYQFTTPSQVGPTAGSSILIPTRQSEPRRNWQSIAQLSRAIAGLRTGIQFNAGSLAAQKQGGFLCLDRPHPFKIYNVPSVCIAAPDSSTDWLRFRVRTGNVGDLDVDGTDQVDNPDSDEVPTDGTGDITITSGVAQFEFWIELTDVSSVKAATIKYGEDPTANGWDDFPDTDGRFIRLGWVDTTDTTNKQGIVRQIIRADIPMGIETFDCGDGGDSAVDYFGYRFDPPPS